MANGLNANLVHKWRRIAKASKTVASTDFISLPMITPGQGQPDAVHVMLEMNQIKVHWPLAHIDRAIHWLRLLQS